MSAEDTVIVKVGFSRSRKWPKALFSWVVRLYESFEHFKQTGEIRLQEYSHVYLNWVSLGSGIDIIYHASGTKLHFINTQFFIKVSKTTHEFCFQIPRSKYKDLVRFCMENAGVDYGMKQILGIAWVKLNLLFGKVIENPYRDGRKSQVCSELVGYFLTDILEYDLPFNLDVAGPRDINEFLLSIGIPREVEEFPLKI